jgi:hypothetical protein
VADGRGEALVAGIGVKEPRWNWFARLDP